MEAPEQKPDEDQPNPVIRLGSTGLPPMVTQRAMTVNLIAGGLGTGMFSLPWSMAGAGIVPGVLMTAFVVALNGWTVMLLVQAAERHQVFDLGSLMRRLPGRAGVVMEGFINFMVWAVLMGSLISYLIAMHDSARPFLERIPWWSAHFSGSRVPVVTLGALLVLPLCFVDQRFLSWSSMVAVCINVYLVVLLFVLAWQEGIRGELPQGTCFLGFGLGSVAMLSVLAQCIIIQMCVLPMYQELQDRSPKAFASALWTAFGALTLVFSIFASLGYLVFGPGAHSNVLTSLQLYMPGNVFSDIAQIGTVLVVWAIYPIMVIPMVAPVRTLSSDPARGKLLVLLATLVCVGLSYLGAALVDELGLVAVIDGALSVGVFTAMAPGFAAWRLLDERPGPGRKVAITALAIFGAAMVVLGFALQDDNYATELSEQCLVPPAKPKTALWSWARAARPLQLWT